MNLSETAKGLFRSLAPVAASFFGTPLAGMAVTSVLDRWLGEDGKPLDPKNVERALAALTPEQALALQKADQEFALRMQELGIKAEELEHEAERIASADRASAREREVKTADWTPRVLAGLIVLGYAVVQWWLLAHVIAPEMREIVMRSLGVLDAALGMCLTYYFGSSSGSREKTETMARLAGGRRRVS